ncbi:MAG TPA: hypothetical protein VFG25_06005 [Nitrosopumilaceae archaeon]|nr:hypothetical protein [Nitrosopumilaceae archaeon]
MELQKAAEKLIKLSPSVRVVTFCDMNGKPVFSAHSKRVRNVLSRTESKESLKNAARAWKMRKKLSRKLGVCKYVVAEYSSVKRITMPAGRNHLLFVSTTASFDHNKLIRKVRSFR